jgi:hypothetical protein
MILNGIFGFCVDRSKRVPELAATVPSPLSAFQALAGSPDNSVEGQSILLTDDFDFSRLGIGVSFCAAALGTSADDGNGRHIVAAFCIPWAAAVCR